MIDAYIFDMDGTLLDTEILYVEAIEAALRELGIAPSRAHVLEDSYGAGWHEVFQNLRRRYPALGGGFQEMYGRIFPHFEALRATRDVRIPSSIALLKRLAEDYPVAIVSGSVESDVAAGIELMGIGGLIEFALDGEHFHPGKPDPTCYRMAAERLNLPPAACLVFEDSEAGIRAAKGAGMHCVAIAQPERPKQNTALADAVLEDLGAFRVEVHGPAA